MNRIAPIASRVDPVGVIGGGLAGLAAACVLAERGHRVILFEKNDWLGGKAAVLEAEGFRFDMGPTILTRPGSGCKRDSICAASIRNGAASSMTDRFSTCTKALRKCKPH